MACFFVSSLINQHVSLAQWHQMWQLFATSLLSVPGRQQRHTTQYEKRQVNPSRSVFMDSNDLGERIHVNKQPSK
jgi:hypothetical protein